MYLYKLRRIRAFLGKEFSEADRSDVERVVAEIYGQGYKPWTVHLYKVALKKFYRCLRKAERDPPEVAWIKVSLKDNEKILPEDILTPEEIKRMLKVAHSLRDKTYVETGYEGGFRPGEMLTLRIRNVEFDLYGTIITVRGKTGSRRVRSVVSSPRLQTWMENHPNRDDPDAWLWVNIGNTNKGKRLSYPSVRKMLRTIATRAKILKRVNPYSFRHARATHLAKVLTEAQMCNFFGWKIGSKAPSVYVHLSGRDLDPPLLAHYGLKKKEELESGIKPRRCPKCEALNSHDAKYCRRCSIILDPEEALHLEHRGRT